MRKSIRIIVSQSIGLSLGREVWAGVLEYARSKPSWIVEAIECETFVNGLLHENWGDFSALILSGSPRAGQVVDALPKTPVVLTHWDPKLLVNQIDVDHHAAGVCAAEFFLRHIPQRYAVMRRMPHPAHRERELAFVRHLREEGHDCRVLHAEETGRTNTTAEPISIVEWVREGTHPVGIYCTEDRTAFYVINELRGAGLQVPLDAWVLGTENDALRCEGATVSVSSVELSYRRVGYEAAQCLDALFGNPDFKPTGSIISGARVVQRNSTENRVSQDPKVQRVIEYLRQHFMEDVKIEGQAAKVGLSASGLRRGFNQALGHGPKEELLRLRLERVKEHLARSNASLERIAELCGFPSGIYLSKIFRKKTGMTTRQFRERNQL